MFANRQEFAGDLAIGHSIICRTFEDRDSFALSESQKKTYRPKKTRYKFHDIRPERNLLCCIQAAQRKGCKDEGRTIVVVQRIY